MKLGIMGALIGDATKAHIDAATPALMIALAIFVIGFVTLLFTQIEEPEQAPVDISLVKGAMKYRHFVLGVIAIFLYMGVEVGTPTYILQYLTSPEMGMDASIVGLIVAVYWLMMLVGRFVGGAIGSKVSSRAMSVEQATLNRAIYIVENHWRKQGLSTDGLFLFDGSGLSPKNAISPMFFVKLLCLMTKSSEFENFYTSLPIAGKSGTVSSFLLGSSLAGNVRLKSGSFGQVQCYVGYLSKKYAFAVMVNNFSCSRKTVLREIEYFLENAILQ